MSSSLTAIYQAMRTDTELVRLIAENVANAQTSNYQRKVGVQQSYSALESGINTLDGSHASPVLSIGRDTTPGTLTETGEILDVALSGAGSLFVVGEDGETAVRGGRLHVDAQGFLVNQAGLQMQGVNGPIHFGSDVMDLSAVSIAGNGVMSVNGVEVGQLRVAAPADNEAMLPQVKQGFIETSNVNAVTEMLKLMETIRHFEAAQRVTRTISDLQQQGIADLGKL